MPRTGYESGALPTEVNLYFGCAFSLGEAAAQALAGVNMGRMRAEDVAMVRVFPMFS